MAASEEDAFEALRRGGAIVLMRHAIAPGGGDPPGFVLEDCATQRNLSDEGREQARRTGALLRAWSLTVAPVPVTVRPGLATATTPVSSPAAAPARTTAASVSLTQVRLTQTVVVGRVGDRAQSTP